MLAKLKEFFGLDDLWGDGQSKSNSNLIDVRTLQAENKQLKAIIKQQNDLLKELLEENMELGRSRRQYADTVTMQQRLIDVYQDMAG
nr:MAG TPA: Monopolin complex subunit CSM1, Monopolin, rDNA, REPLICATION.9A [Caudoviricetes sp.]